MAISSYPTVYNLGHRAIADLFLDPVLVQEKVDGSQISFGLVPSPDPDVPGGGEIQYILTVRSKGAEINTYAPDKMFAPGVEIIKGMVDHLTPGWVYRGEYLAKTKHNVLAYDRTPDLHIIIFDIQTGPETYMDPYDVQLEAARLGFETVPILYEGMISDPQVLRDLLKLTSVLGGPTIEGMVIKNYARFGTDKKALMGKFVSEQFKEVHAGEWKKANPGGADIIAQLVMKYRSPARWMKAVQHLREAGKIQDAPQDIGLLIPEIAVDTEKECRGEIMEFLYSWAWPKVRRAITHGFPEWYKERLLERQFEREMRDDGVAQDLQAQLTREAIAEEEGVGDEAMQDLDDHTTPGLGHD